MALVALQESNAWKSYWIPPKTPGIGPPEKMATPEKRIGSVELSADSQNMVEFPGAKKCVQRSRLLRMK